MMTQIRTVLLDIGGVLTLDPWETLLLTPEHGIADQLGLDRSQVETVGAQLWPQFSLALHEEERYWFAFGEALGCIIPPEIVQIAETRAFRINSVANQVINSLEHAEVNWGIISDNTAFWYPKQLQLLNLEGRVEDAAAFLSHKHGLSKKAADRSLFELAAQWTDPTQTLVIDDRQHNLDRAADFGFQAAMYSLYTDADEDLLTLLHQHLPSPQKAQPLPRPRGAEQIPGVTQQLR